MLTISHAWQGMTAWVNSATRSVTALLAMAAGRLHAAPESKTEGDGQVSFMALRLLRARGDSDTKSGSIISTVNPTPVSHRDDHGTYRDVAEGKTVGVVEAEPTPSDLQTTRGNIGASVFPFVHSGSEGYLTINLRAAGCEARRYVWMGDNASKFKTRVDQAMVVPFPFDYAAHEGMVSSELLTAAPSIADPLTAPLAVCGAQTDRAAQLTDAGVLRAAAEGRHTMAGEAGMALWYPPIYTTDGTLYVRQTWGGAETDADTLRIS